ncbi:MAG: ATP F0F1 synthase subunit B [Bacteroides sp. SM23_62_1]|nr:MAG: ATP F0F1 synthase subunit B [Bacteroides sp. SM23_62_1]
MELITPGIGLLFWMLLMFGIVLWLLKKFAWKPIMNALKEREMSIQEALMSADNARKEMEKLQADNEKIMAEARAERDTIIRDAKQAKDKMVNEAKEQASDEARKIIQAARIEIANEKTAAINEIKNKVAEISIQIAEKILREKLADSKKQKEMIEKLIKEIKPN